MKASRTFRYVWRINGITILIATLLLIFVFSALLWDLSGGLFRSKTRRNTVQVAEHLIDTAEFSFGDFEAIAGFPVLRTRLLSTQDYGGKFSSGSSTAIRNFLFYDYEEDVGHWLVGDNEQLFSWHAEVATPETPVSEKTVLSLLYQVVTEDTDGDSHLTAADKSHLAISDPKGRNYETMLTGIDSREGYRHIGDGRILLFFHRDKQLRVAEIDTTTRSVVRDSELLPAPQRETP